MTATTESAYEGPRFTVPLILVAIALAIRFVPAWITPFTIVHFIGLGIGPLVGVLGLVLWWVFARRTPRADRWIGLVAGLALLAGTFAAAHPTMTQTLVTYALVLFQVGFVVALVATRRIAWARRRWLLVAVCVATLIPWQAARSEGQSGDLATKLVPRWLPTAEERFLATRAGGSGSGTAGADLATTTADWPGYRGPERNGHALEVSFATDWESQPPRELWRRQVGPGWSSFAVAGDLVFTQEQRGEEEVLAAYSLADGSEVWARGSAERFEEPASGAGPRATPTFAGGSLFALSASGTLQSLDAANGEPRWSVNLVDDFEAALPTWGFSSSPLVAGQAVIVFSGAGGGRSVAAYDAETGDNLWSAGHGAMSYSSAHLATIGGVEQVLMSTDRGLQSLEPESGEVLWEHDWALPQMARIVQPVVLDGGDSVILGTGYGEGSRRLDVSRRPTGEWTVTEAWHSRFLKPYFNGLVCHEGHCYGFDGKIFTAIGAEDGERRWKGGRYGHGQVMLLPKMDLLLVLTEQGDVVLVEATPEEHRELARFPALEGKTWNHPVIARNRLLVRNAEEAACFELPGA